MTARKAQQRPLKILVAMHDLSGGTTKSLKYEDIVVRAFEMFPEEFALRGYPRPSPLNRSGRPDASSESRWESVRAIGR